MKTNWFCLINVVLIVAMVAVADAQLSSEQIETLRKDAEQGYAEAQDVLGLAYANGVGVAKDQREAVRWWRKAAAQGYTQAQRLNLGWAYATLAQVLPKINERRCVGIARRRRRDMRRRN